MQLLGWRHPHTVGASALVPDVPCGATFVAGWCGGLGCGVGWAHEAADGLGRLVSVLVVPCRGQASVGAGCCTTSASRCGGQVMSRSIWAATASSGLYWRRRLTALRSAAW